jgi:hypothetical protein
MIDWAIFDQKQWPESTVTCINDHTYRSHAKYVMNVGIEARRPCPTCGLTKLRAARSDPEIFTIGGK